MSDAPIHDLPAASAVAGTDLVPIDQGLVTRKATMTQVSQAVGPINVGQGIHNANSKTTPIDPDEFGVVDTADGNTLKKVTWANIKATLLTYFSALTGLWNISTTGNAATATTTTGNAGSATKLQTARNLDVTSFDGTTDVKIVAPAIHAATNKGTPVDADEAGIWDSVSGLINKVTWANIKATLKTYFDGIYVALTNLAASGGSALVGFIQSGTGAVATTVQQKLRYVANVKDFGATGDGTTDDTVAIQAAHDALPANGGILYFSDGFYNLATDAVYVNITKPNVTVTGSSGAWVINPASDDAEVLTGSSILNGFNITGNNCTLNINMRGCLNSWTPASATDNLTMRDMKMLNLYNSGISINNTPFDTLDIDGVEFNTSRALASDTGNYEAISRACNGDVANYGQLVRIARSSFIGVSGGVDVHNVKNVVIGSGTRFKGCDILAIKVSTLDTVTVKQNLTVDETVIFDGAAVNAASANRHLNCTGGGRTTANYAQYLAFIQVFDKVDFHGKAYNFGNVGVNFLNGSFTSAILNFDDSEFVSCPTAILNIQGNVSMVNMRLENANIFSTSASILSRLNFSHNRMIDSYVAITKRVTLLWSPILVLDNNIDYSLDNLAPVRLVNYGTDTGPAMLVDGNTINVTFAGATLCVDGSTSGTKAFIGFDNKLSAVGGTPTFNGNILAAFEQTTTSGYSGALNAPIKKSLTVVNTNSAGTITYILLDAVSTTLDIGAVIEFYRTHASNALVISCANGINGASTLTFTAQYSGATLKKIAANTWIITSAFGTYTLA